MTYRNNQLKQAWELRQRGMPSQRIASLVGVSRQTTDSWFAFRVRQDESRLILAQLGQLGQENAPETNLEPLERVWQYRLSGMGVTEICYLTKISKSTVRNWLAFEKQAARSFEILAGYGVDTQKFQRGRIVRVSHVLKLRGAA